MVDELAIHRKSIIRQSPWDTGVLDNEPSDHVNRPSERPGGVRDALVTMIQLLIIRNGVSMIG